MPTTPILALPYPASSDPADVPADMGELANAIDDSVIPLDQKAVANGVASLGSDGKVPTAQLPPISAGGGVVWEGAYSAATAYQAGDLVSYNGRYWLAAQPSTGSTPA